MSEANTSQQPAAPSGDSGGDLSATIADVFGLDFGGDSAPAPESPNGAPAPEGPASVGTDGEAGGGGTQPPAAPASAPQSPPTPPAAPSAPAQPQQPEATPPAAPGGQPEQAPAFGSPEAALQFASMQNQLALALQEIENLKAGGAAPQAGQPEQGAPGAPPKVVPLPVQLPRPVIDAIMGEDPQRAEAALNHVVTAIATGLNHRFETRLAAEVAAMNDRFSRVEQLPVQQEQAAEAQRLRDDYFAAFPEHNKPIFQTLLAQEASALQAALPGAPWDENFRNALGARVTEKLKEAGFPVGMQPAAEPPAPVAAAPAAPAAFLPTGARPAAEPEDANIIADTFALSFDE